MKTSKTVLLYFILIFNIVHLSAQDKIVFDSTTVTPNGMFIGDNLMCDRTEVSNSFWKEYMHWVKTAHGESSKLYKATMPDTIGYIYTLPIITSTDTSFFQLSKYSYFRLPNYDDYPITGITLKQAKLYCEWRSDRVLEMLLIVKGLIKVRQNRATKNPFTIKKFLTKKKYKDERELISFYPQFYIADIDDWTVIKNLIQKKEISVGKINSKNTYEAVLLETNSPLLPKCYEDEKREGLLYNILGNVSELIDSENQCVGGNINDKTSDILKMEVTECNLPDKLVGFRCLSKWVKI